MNQIERDVYANTQYIENVKETRRMKGGNQKWDNCNEKGISLNQKWDLIETYNLKSSYG